MGLLNLTAPSRPLIVVRGHPYEREAFRALFEAVPGCAPTFVEQPAAAHLIHPAALGAFTSLVFYDMGGIDFLAPERPSFHDPPRALVDGLEAVLAEGRLGMLFLHHAAAAWPRWERWAELVGARFFYLPGMHKGVAWPDSGYAHEVTHHVAPRAAHPVLAGLEAGFTLTDELYLWPVFDDGKQPLLASDAVFTEDRFFSAAAAVAGRLHDRAGWSHPPGSNLFAWERREGPTRLVTIQGGDGPDAYTHPGFQRLIANTLHHLEGRPPS